MEDALNAAKALADGNRMRVVAALLAHEELCVCQIVEMLDLATATVSRHMSILQNARIVKSRKDGRWVFYRMTQDFPEALKNWLAQSLANSRQIKADNRQLKKILACNRQDLCQRQKATKFAGKSS
ncbi:MAG: metalloregulator ArsR/SmtB family transcription factor [Desulfatibacillaceae bacterium]|nr:metalloregulator ArsR/SmtB family transcription factor [Desulfatibacillaceae bacterium]